MTPLRDKVSAILAAALPGYSPGSVELLGTGSEHITVLVDATLVLRFPAGPADPQVPSDAAAEAAVLQTLGGLLSVPLPTVVFVAGDCLAYRLLPGAPLLGSRFGPATDSTVGTGIVAGLAGMLADLHRLTPQQLPAVGSDPSHPRDYLPDTQHWAGLLIDHLRETGADPDIGPRIERFLTDTPPEGTDELLFSHQDLGIEHVLTDGTSLTGLIDWSDATFGDPARDFGLLWRDLGRDAFDLLCRRYIRAGGPVTIDADFVDRCRFIAVCGLLEDWVYGLTPGRERYADKSRALAAELLSR